MVYIIENLIKKLTAIEDSMKFLYAKNINIEKGGHVGKLVYKEFILVCNFFKLRNRDRQRPRHNGI